MFGVGGSAEEEEVFFEDAEVDEALFEDFVELFAVFEFFGEAVFIEDLALEHFDLGLGYSLVFTVDCAVEELHCEDFKVAALLIAGV